METSVPYPIEYKSERVSRKYYKKKQPLHDRMREILRDVSANSSVGQLLGVDVLHSIMEDHEDSNFEEAFNESEARLSNAIDRIQCFKTAASKAESPIEKLFILAVFAIIENTGDFFTSNPDDENWKAGFYDICIIPQKQIGRYRVDFEIQFTSKKSKGPVVVECDGHDFHSTKKALAHDKKRDRFLQKTHHVLRFTGSEIWANPIHCAAEALSWSGEKYFIQEFGSE